MVKEDLSVRFANGLKEYGLTIEDMDNWWYCGSSSSRDGGTRHYLNTFPNAPFPKHKEHGICSQKITGNCYITNFEKTQVLIVGSCCIKKFLPKGHNRIKCSNCNNVNTRRIGDTCKECSQGKCDYCLKKCSYNKTTCFDCSQNPESRPVINYCAACNCKN